MSRTANIVLVGVLCGAGFVAGRYLPAQGMNGALAAQPEKGKPGEPPAMDPKMMEAFAKSSTPTEMHKHLEVMLGTWEGTVKFWMAPGTEPMSSAGSAHREMAMGGRFIIEHVDAKSDMGPFKGMGIVGYNTVENKFESVWIEDHATYISTADGAYDTKAKTFTFTGDMLDPMTGKRSKQRSVMDCSDPEREVMTGYATGPDGKEYKCFEGDFKKKK